MNTQTLRAGQFIEFTKPTLVMTYYGRKLEFINFFPGMGKRGKEEMFVSSCLLKREESFKVVGSLIDSIHSSVPFDRDYLGEPTITYVPLDPGTTAVTLKCEVPFNRNIQSWKNVTYRIVWYSEGSYLKTDDHCGTLPPDTKEYENPCPGKPLISLLSGLEYNLNRWVSDCYE